MLGAREAIEAPSRAAAISIAKRLATTNANAIAFARTRRRRFKDAEIIAKFGDGPEDLSEL